MAKRNYTTEQIIGKLLQAEVILILALLLAALAYASERSGPCPDSPDRDQLDQVAAKA